MLTIAGSDSGGGAGIQADLKTFAALGVHGTSVVTCITAQNPAKVLAVEACRPEIVRKQLHAVFEELRPKAVKTGMLYSAEIVREVARLLRKEGQVPLVIDPVMISTSGARLLEDDAIGILQKELFPRATIITPNLAEAGLLLKTTVTSLAQMWSAAKELQKRFGCSVLIKGGHLKGMREAMDVFYEGKEEWFLSAPFIRGIRTHGTGCTYSAAITANLARGLPLLKAVASAKDYISDAIARSKKVGKHTVLGF